MNKIEEIISKENGKVIIDFWATWCGPCRMLSPVLDEIVSENADIKLFKFDVDENQELVEQFRISNVPTLLFYNNGKLLDIINGLKSKQEILEIINRK